MTPLFSISEIRMTPKMNIRKTANQNNVKILYPRPPVFELKKRA